MLTALLTLNSRSILAAVRANLLSLPEILQVVVVEVLKRGSDVVYLLVAASPVDTAASESTYIKHTVRIPATEKVGEVEHEIYTRSHIFKLIFGVVRLFSHFGAKTSPAALAPESVHLSTESEKRRELIANSSLNIRRE